MVDFCARRVTAHETSANVRLQHQPPGVNGHNIGRSCSRIHYPSEGVLDAASMYYLVRGLQVTAALKVLYSIVSVAASMCCQPVHSSSSIAVCYKQSFYYSEAKSLDPLVTASPVHGWLLTPGVPGTCVTSNRTCGVVRTRVMQIWQHHRARHTWGAVPRV
jgi:hypothetical protein